MKYLEIHSLEKGWHDKDEILVTIQVGRLKAKTVRKNGDTAHFEAMFDARICSSPPKCVNRAFWTPSA